MKTQQNRLPAQNDGKRHFISDNIQEWANSSKDEGRGGLSVSERRGGGGSGSQNKFCFDGRWTGWMGHPTHFIHTYRANQHNLPVTSSDQRRIFKSKGRRLNGFLGLSLNDRTIHFLAISLDKTVSVR